MTDAISTKNTQINVSPRAKLLENTMDTFFRKDLVNKTLKNTTMFRIAPSVPNSSWPETTRWFKRQQR